MMWFMVWSVLLIGGILGVTAWAWLLLPSRKRPMPRPIVGAELYSARRFNKISVR